LLIPLLACALAGCADFDWGTRMPAWRMQAWPLVTTPDAPDATIDLVDGTYKGEAELVSAQGPDCPAGRPGTIGIGDRRLIYPYQSNVVFVAPIRADGGFSATADAATLEGRIEHGKLQFTVRSPSCESRYTLHWTM